MARFETLKPQMEAAYFESFSGISPLLDVELPNEPDWESFKTPNGRGGDRLSYGLAILENNRNSLYRQGLRIPTQQVPEMIQGMLGLDQEELDRFMGGKEGEGGDMIPVETFEERFLVAKFLSDYLGKKLIEGAIPEVIRRKAKKLGGRNVIEMVGDGDGVLLVGHTYYLLEWMVLK